MGILVGMVIAYEEAQGRARIRLRASLHRGEHVQIVGARTDCEFKLKAPRLCECSGGAAEAGELEIDVLTPPVETGDMVFRIVGEQLSYAALSA